MQRCHASPRRAIPRTRSGASVGLIVTLITLVSVLGAGAAAALATTSAPANFSLRFNPRAPRSLAAIRLNILYKNPQHPNEPNSPPPPLKSVTIKAPTGTVFDGSAVPPCHASDQQLMVEGKSACPAGSVVGGGTGSVILGTPPATSTEELDATLINYGAGIIELFTDPNTGTYLADDRASFEGPSTMVLHPPVDPGVTERAFAFKYDAVRGSTGKAFITTPRRCPADRLWRSTLDYTVSSGASYTVTSTTPCVASASKSHGHRRKRRSTERRHHQTRRAAGRGPSFTG